MSQQWHYSQDGAQYGPVDETEIIRLIQDGELAPSTPVLKVGSMDWQPARNHACFQVEIYPKKKRPSVQAAAVTASKPASGGTSQSPRQTATQPAATSSSPAVVTPPAQMSTVLPWVLVGILGIAVLYFAFKPAPSVEDFANAPQNTGAGGPPPIQPVVPISPPATPAKKPALPTPVVIPVTPPITSTPGGSAGTVLWEFETGDGVSCSPAIGSDGTVYVGSRGKKLYAIKTESLGLAKSPWPIPGQNARHTGRALKE